MEASASAGKAVEIPLEIRNTAGDSPREIELRLVDLSQSTDGGWRLIEPGSGEDTSKLYSSLAWTSLAENHLTIDPLQPAQVMVRVDVPADARGVYFAGIIAETPLPADITGVVVRIRFLIPLIVQITGRPVRQQVALTDVEMNYNNGADGAVPTTTANLVISNEGRTFSRISGRLSVERQNGDQWRPVTRLVIAEKSIIPGVTLALGEDLKRRLPSGAYRLRGELSVDGRRIPPITKEIAFVGDSAAAGLAYDTALLLEPGSVSMDVVPGATRTTTLTIENPGTVPVQVSMASHTPPGLVGVALGEFQGTQLSAEPWTEIRPAQFTIRPGRRQNVRVISSIPREGVKFPNYYADLVLDGTYADGQSAGETRSTVHLSNGAIPSIVDGVVEQLDLAQGADSTQYIVQMRLANIGNVHLEPSARVFLVAAAGGQIRNVALSGDEGMLLPLGKRIFSAELDMSGIEPGYYALRTIVSLGEGKDISKQQVVLVQTQEIEGPDGKVTSVPLVTIDPELTEFPEGVEVQTQDGPVVTLNNENRVE